MCFQQTGLQPRLDQKVAERVWNGNTPKLPGEAARGRPLQRILDFSTGRAIVGVQGNGWCGVSIYGASPMALEFMHIIM
jgi:hypothetical protein